MKNKIYVKCLIENNPYTLDFETQLTNISIKTIESICIEQIKTLAVDNQLEQNITLIWANIVDRNLPTTQNIKFNNYFKSKYINSLKNEKIESLKNEARNEKNIFQLESILNEIIRLKEKLFSDFQQKMNFGHEGY